MSFFPLFRQSIQLRSIIKPHDKLIVAVSGGIDSVVLLDLLFRLQEEFKLRLIIAHLNHNVRGKESLLDAEFVKKIALEKGLVFKGKTLRKNLFSNLGNFQEKARKLRYAFLVQTAKKYRMTKIVTAHQADDQVETFLMRLIRGAGVEGLKGMEFSRSLDEKKKIFLIRPLLSFSRAEISQYAKERRLKWREDPTNRKLDYLRNRIRHRLIDEMKKINPLVIQSISNAVSIIQEENKIINDYLLKNIEKLIHYYPNKVTISLPGLKKQKRAIRYRIYRIALLKIVGELLGIQKEHLDSIEKMVIKKNDRAKITLPHGFGASLDRNRLLIKRWSSNKRVQKQRGFFC